MPEPETEEKPKHEVKYKQQQHPRYEIEEEARVNDDSTAPETMP